MVDFVELSNERTNSVRTIEELLVEFVPQTLKRYFHNFLLKANQQFVEILTTTYIFSSIGVGGMSTLFQHWISTLDFSGLIFCAGFLNSYPQLRNQI